QTLYTVLVTLTKLCAPVMPFLCETMYQNLRARSVSEGNRHASVHHSDYPQPDPTLKDAQLSQDMEALLRLVSLGSAARNAVKIRVRQPLAELKVQPGSDAERSALNRFPDQIEEELNLKLVTVHEASNAPLLELDWKLNPKVAGPKF